MLVDKLTQLLTAGASFFTVPAALMASYIVAIAQLLAAVGALYMAVRRRDRQKRKAPR